MVEAKSPIHGFPVTKSKYLHIINLERQTSYTFRKHRNVKGSYFKTLVLGYAFIVHLAGIAAGRMASTHYLVGINPI